VQALRDHLPNVTLLTGQSDFQDYCFLQSAAADIVGSEISSFAKVAAFAATTNVRLYSLFYSGKIKWKRLPNEHSWRKTGVFIPYNFTHPELQRRFHIVPIVDERKPPE
jgi:hypothetical protein